MKHSGHPAHTTNLLLPVTREMDRDLERDDDQWQKSFFHPETEDDHGELSMFTGSGQIKGKHSPPTAGTIEDDYAFGCCSWRQYWAAMDGTLSTCEVNLGIR